jgi:signal transduction histidine kinase
VIVLVDITRVRELERARDEFLSIASHELKTPLTPMLSITELIARALDRGEPVDRLLVGRLLRQIQRLDGLVVEMLDLARLGEGRLDVALDPVPLRPLIDRVVEDYRDSAPRHEIRWCPPAAPLIVRGDEHRLEEVLSNIVENAVKYSPAGGPIDIILSVAGGRAEIAVRDRGIGIPAADLPHMFERFRRGRNVARHYGGLGVGLFISREIVRRHGGDVRVESIEGKGTRVVIELPLA